MKYLPLSLALCLMGILINLFLMMPPQMMLFGLFFLAMPGILIVWIVFIEVGKYLAGKLYD
jgi:hypothetical protein